MSFLKNIFGSSDKNIDSTEKSKKSIADIFTENIEKLPDDTYFLSRKEKDSSGKVKFFFSKKLNVEECGLFERVEVILHSVNNYNVIFESGPFYDSNKLEELTNALYSIYGKDDNKKGLFSATEKDEIKNQYWQGRNFFDEGKYPNLPPCTLYESDGKIHLTIYNPNKIEIDTSEQSQTIKSEPKGKSLLDKLNNLGIDFHNYSLEGTDLEFTVEEEIKGITKKVFLPLENHFFTSSILSIFEKGNKNLFFSKTETTEKDFKTFIDKTSDLFGLDVAGRGKFTLEDLNIIRGDNQEENDVYGIRHWIDMHSEYEIVITFDEEEKDLLLMIYNT